MSRPLDATQAHFVTRSHLTRLILQSPYDPQEPNLLESLIDVCSIATSGGGCFAWATADGLQLLFEDQVTMGLLERGEFRLVFGLDAVTNERAILKLRQLVKAFPNLKASVFVHNEARAIFHPKFSWFDHKGGTTMLVGSGNLTVGGLQSNWEAFGRVHMGVADAAAVKERWYEWLHTSARYLHDPTDEVVMEEAKKNKGWRPRGRPIPKAGTEDAAPVEAASVSLVDPSDEVLVAEIPRAANRWNQANFDLENYEGFFGAKVGSRRRIVLRAVADDGTVGPLESRPSVEVASRNFRFELAAAAGRAYPTSGRPIGVFLREAPGVFLYRLILPQHRGYRAFADFLGKSWGGRADRMRRVRTTAGVLSRLVPEDSLWSASSNEV